MSEYISRAVETHLGWGRAEEKSEGDVVAAYSSKCGLWNSSSSITWELIRKAESQAHSRHTVRICIFTRCSMIHRFTKVWHGMRWRSKVAFCLFISCIRRGISLLLDIHCWHLSIVKHLLLEIINFWELLIQCKRIFLPWGLWKDPGLGLSHSPLDYMALW